MGGNVTATTKSGIQTRASKIPVKEIGLSVFRTRVQELFFELNRRFNDINRIPLWESVEIIKSGYVFNGSTSFLMDPKYNDEILDFKSYCGDIDITVPRELKEELWKYLQDIEETEIIPGVVFMGSNKPTIQSIGEQINAVFTLTFEGKSYNCQVDFEFLEYENDKPTDWAKFSHSSNIVDTQENIKAVHHKFLIRALVGSSSYRDDIIICTQKSSPEKIQISKSKIHAKPRMFKFSVGKGLRIAYEQMLDNLGNPIIIDNKILFRDIDSKKSEYITDIREICEHTFLQESVSDKDLVNFESFIGCLSLMRKYLPREVIQETHDRYIDLLWGNPRGRAQELEAGNPDLDRKIKINGYQKFISVLQLQDKSHSFIVEYYKNYGQRGR